jgi:hypothetical protein
MSAEASPKVRGTIVKVPDASPGLLFVNGEQKSFTLEGLWKSPVAPAANMTVDVDLDGAGAITALRVVDSQQLNKERLNQLSGVAQERGKEAAKLAQQGVGALAARTGKVALATLVVLWIVWFFLPGYKIDLGFVGSQSFTFWQFLGIDMGDPSTLAAGGANHGFFSLLGLLAIVAPLAAPFVPDPRAKYLNALPLAYIVIAIAAMKWNISRATAGLGADVSSAIGMQFGTYVLILAGLVLAAQAFKGPASARS